MPWIIFGLFELTQFVVKVELTVGICDFIAQACTAHVLNDVVHVGQSVM